MIIKELTQRQQNFARLIFQGKTQHEAYCQAGYKVAVQARETIENNASRLANTDRVKAYIDALNKAAEAKSQYTLQARKDRLQFIAEEDNPSNVEGGNSRQPCINAIDTINKMEKIYETGGIHIDKIEVTIIEGQPPPGYQVPVDVKAKPVAEPEDDEGEA